MPTKYLHEWLKVWLKFQADSIEGRKKGHFDVASPGKIGLPDQGYIKHTKF